MEVSITRKNHEHKILIDDEDYDKIKDLNLIIQVESNFKNRVFDSKSNKSLHRFIIPSKANQICIHKNNDKCREDPPGGQGGQRSDRHTDLH